MPTRWHSHLMIVMCARAMLGGMTELALIPSGPLDLSRASLPTLAGAWLASFSSERTREAYRSDLQAFESFLMSHNAGPVLAVSRPVVDLYARELEAASYSPATRARRLAALSSFFDYALSAGVTSHNPAKGIRRPKLPNYSPRLGLNLDTAPKVVQAVEGMSSAHRALVGLCLFAGLRVSEALSVKASDIRTEAGHTVVEVISKGGRRDLVPLSPVAIRLLSGVLDEHPSGPVLAGIDRFRAGRMVAAIGREAGLDRPLTPHDLRHASATCALEAGEPIHRVQQLLRHASPVTTQRYDHSRDRLDRSAAYGLAMAIGGAR